MIIYGNADWKNYEIKYQPNIWWNSTDGIKLGLNINGGYLRHHHLLMQPYDEFRCCSR